MSERHPGQPTPQRRHQRFELLNPSPWTIPEQGPRPVTASVNDINRILRNQEEIKASQARHVRTLEMLSQRIAAIEITQRDFKDVLLTIQRDVGVIKQGSMMRSDIRSQTSGHVSLWGT